MKSHIHSKNSVKRWGGDESDFQAIHDFIDQSKSHFPDVRHRALLHSSFGLYIVGEAFGHLEVIGNSIVKRPYIITQDNVKVSVKDIAEHHILEDLGRIPTVQDYLQNMKQQVWMSGLAGKRLEKLLERAIIVEGKEK